MSVLRRLTEKAGGRTASQATNAVSSKPALAWGPDLIPIGMPHRARAVTTIASAGPAAPVTRPVEHASIRTQNRPEGRPPGHGSTAPISESEGHAEDLGDGDHGVTGAGRERGGSTRPPTPGTRRAAGALRGPVEVLLPTRNRDAAHSEARRPNPAGEGTVRARPEAEGPSPSTSRRRDMDRDGVPRSISSATRRGVPGPQLVAPRPASPRRAVTIRIGRIDLTAAPEAPAPVVERHASATDALADLAPERSWAERIGQ
jgi:hypothetical protein